MKLIKLHTIESTNSFLKELLKESKQENFTVVVTSEQTAGRGQIQNTWQSEPFKNLTFSVFVSFNRLLITHYKYLNFAVSLAIFDVLKGLQIPNLQIKWPNDILSETKKICGILIENIFKGGQIESAVIGIGLNINQTEFINLPNATSLKNTMNKEFDLDELLVKIIDSIKENIYLLSKNDFSTLEGNYLQNLYKFNKPSMFKDNKGSLFMGKIIGVSSEGKLEVELKDETERKFGIKEINFVVK